MASAQQEAQTRRYAKDRAGYRSWASMWERCRNPRHAYFHNYGGRGITVCDRWRSSAAFFEDLGERPEPGLTLERLDNSSGYWPGNVIWADRKTQARNRRPPADPAAVSRRVSEQMRQRWAGHIPAWTAAGCSRSTWYRRKWRAERAAGGRP